MLSVTTKHTMLNVLILTVVILNVTNKHIMLNVVILNVVMLSVILLSAVAPV